MQVAADLVKPGGVNLALEILFNDGTANFTYRLRRYVRESSHGYLQAERLGITPERLKSVIVEDIRQGLYSASDTRLVSES